MNKIARRDFLKAAGVLGAAGLLTACGGSSSSTAASSTASSAAASSAAPASGDVTLTMSWWGGESRHVAYQEALEAFSKKNPSITVNPTYAAWSGWEDTMSTKFASGVAEDVCQVNWNWLYRYSGSAQTFIDMNEVSDYIDFSQWEDSALKACYVANAQQAVPVSITGRIFYWNMTTFKKAGINFLLNETEGAEIMGSQCGIPVSKAGLAAAQAAGAIESLVEESNRKVLEFCTFQFDPLFEDDTLKAEGTGIYQEVFNTMDYDDSEGADVVDMLLDGMETAGYTI